MISFEFHFKPNGQQVHACFENFVHDNGQIDHTWQTRSYVENGQLLRHDSRKAIRDETVEEILNLCLEKDIERVIVHAEDNIVNIMPNDTGFRIVTFDAMSGGVFRNMNVTKDEVKAVIVVAIFGDDHRDSAKHYPLAEKVFDGCPIECRPIP